jgi:hypothetical protein
LKNEEDAAMPLAGGIMQYGYQCGMVWGSAIAAGAQTYRLFGPGPQAETKAVIAAQRLVESFHALNNDINCLEITGLDKSSSAWQMIIYFLIKSGTIKCFNRAVKYAKVAFDEIDTTLSKETFEVPSAPVSCAAILAKKKGASELHTVMAAGLAGGIGLSGGACGALGAAIWITGINSLEEEGTKLDYKSPRTEDLINRFLKCADYEFECSEIVGRKFENISDHACYLGDGGCSKIIEVLASAHP